MEKFNKSTAKKVAAAGLSVLMMMGSMSAFAASTAKNSLASVNATDNGTTIGFDETQNKKTAYATLAEDATQTVDVYATQASTFEVTVPEQLVIDGAYGAAKSYEADYEVDVKGNIAGDEQVTVAPDASFKMSQEGKEDLDVTVTQGVTKFRDTTADITADTAAVNGVNLSTPVTTTGNIATTGMTAGSWAGNFDFAISLDTVE